MDNLESASIGEGTIHMIEERFGEIPELKPHEIKRYHIAELDLDHDYVRLEGDGGLFSANTKEYLVVNNEGYRMIARRESFRNREENKTVKDYRKITYWFTENYSLTYDLYRGYHNQVDMSIELAVEPERTKPRSEIGSVRYEEPLDESKEFTFSTPYFDAAAIMGAKLSMEKNTNLTHQVRTFFNDEEKGYRIQYVKNPDDVYPRKIAFGEWFTLAVTHPFSYATVKNEESYTLVKANSVSQTTDIMTFPKAKALHLEEMLALANAEGREWGDIYKKAMVEFRLGVQSVADSNGLPELPSSV